MFGRGSSGTMKKRKAKQGSRHYQQLESYAIASLGSGDLKSAVVCPNGEDLNEWLAWNVIEFYNQINVLYGSIKGFCTATSCPSMSAGPRYEYLWADGKKKKATKCTAPQYVEYLMAWIQDLLDDESVFPSEVGR
eukprot:TRINITY_DN3366_c0_g1_i2.p1 TRINITY_DN3366_c0_g1~~TRINITY_DN3366_c0_g1_i2.p1  ORF type:complete len:135 (+),score=27.84 TRINITY_DN3366_c0_g1_i2:36-440(+)